MSKRFSITKQIDFDKLNIEIDNYIHKTEESHPYIFANRETIIEMCKVCWDKDDFQTMVGDGYNFATGKYKGYNIFKNNDLEFGEIELR